MADAAEKRKGTRRRAKRAASNLGRLLTLLAVLAVVAALYLTLRTWVVEGLIRDVAQSFLHPLISADIDRVGRVEIDADGNLVLHRVVISTEKDGVRRLFYRADRIVIALDGWPLRDANLRVARIDIFHPEIYVRRDKATGWNLLWALRPRPKPPEPERKPEPPPPALPPPVLSRPVIPKPAGDPFPFNGIHLHDGVVHIAIEGREGREVSYVVRQVEARIVRRGGKFEFEPIYGDFYGGRLSGHATVQLKPFAIDARIAVENADVGRLSERASFVRRPVSGRLDGVLSVTSDPETNQRPVGAGRIEITQGNLWNLPAFTGILGLLSLNPVSDRIVKSAQVIFTIEREHVRIDEMNFLGDPISLFGEGTMGLTGDDLNLVFVPKLEKDILSLIVAPVALLTDLALGQWVPVVVTGSFWAPQVGVEPEAKVREEIQKRAGGTKKTGP